MPIITLLTDYGTRDYYAAAVKGVILSLCPEARIVDVSHDIEPFHVAHGAFVLRQVWPWFPQGTIHVAVVDPGVGSDRRILLGKYAGQYVIAPDNGLLTWLHRDFQPELVHVVEDRQYSVGQVSSTFHGRDVMAPAAAHLARGVKPRAFGRVADRIETLPIPVRAEPAGTGWVGRVIYVDRFGTLVTNLRTEQLSGGARHKPWEILVNGERVGPVRFSFQEVAPGTPVAFIGGSGFLEVAVNQGSATERFGPPDGVRVEAR